KQTLPDAIEDGDIPRTVASVLDGAENVLSIFFTNSSSALRKVKTDRIKRKQIILTKEHDCSSADTSPTSSAASSEQRTADQAPGRLPSPPPVETGEIGITQWSPLSLSEISRCTVDTSCHDNNPVKQVENKILTEQLRSDPGQLVRPPMKLTDSGFTKKKRTFVYTVKTSKTQVQGKETPSRKMDSDFSGNTFLMHVKCKNAVIHSKPFSTMTKLILFDLPSVHTSGFKTASHKGIHISSANLERAKRLLEETEEEMTLSDRPTKCAHDTEDEMSMSDGSVKNPTTNSNQPLSSSEKNADISCQLTASQKADVTELCTLLEEADSQFEFTQFKTAKLKQHCQDNGTTPKEVDRELDPDFLSGIDFDDSFSSEAEKHLAVTVMHDKMALVSDGKPNCETSNTKTSQLENKNPLMLGGVGFKTAGGNVLKVSKKCLSKARALFADLEENLVTSQNPPDKQNSKTDAKTTPKHSVDNHTGDLLHCKKDNSKFTGDTGERVQSCFSNTMESVCSDRKPRRDEDAMKTLKNSVTDTTTRQRGFQIANGKGISISAKSMQEEDAFFRNCDVVSGNAGMSVKPKKSIPLPGSVSLKETLPKGKHVQGIKENLSEEPINEFENGNAGPAARHNVDSHNFGVKSTLALTNAASFRENPSSTAKAHSSLSCTTSKSIGPSAISELSNGGGFCLASGEKVSTSADVPPSKNGSFQMASGKRVAISSAALKKAKTLLSECDKVEDKICVKPTHSKMAMPGPPPRNSGFLAASGKPVAFSSEALQKAKALFSDISLSAEIPAVPDTRNSDKKQDNADNTEKKHCGFTTAGGAKVHVSQKNLLKAKNLLEEFDDGSFSAKAMQEADAFFKDCDIMDDNDAMSVKHQKSIASVSGSGIGKKNLSKFKNEVSVNISENPGGGRTELENVNMGLVVNHEKMLQPDDVEIHKGVVKNTLDSTKAPSLHGNPTLMTEPLSLRLCTTSIGSSANNELSKGGGFATASGKKVSVSDDAMTKAKSLLNESATFEDTNKQLKHKEDIFPTRNGGFQMASGKGVTISSAALKKAKTLLSECDKVEDKICVKPTHSKMAVPGPPPRNSGFLAASGKPVAFSSEAHQKAKALFSDISLSAEIPAVPDIRNSDKKQDNADNTEKKHCGFTTAGGAKVHVSQKNLLKAKNLLEELADGECHSNSYSTSPHNTHKSDLSKVKDVKRTLNCNLSPEEEMSSVLDCEINQTSSSEGSNVKRPQDSSVVNFQSLNLSGCTETQQRFFAQEALDCTKALLEDESLAGQSLSMTLENDLHNVELARDMQDMRIRKKKRQTIRPLPGSLFLTKTSGLPRIPLKAAVNGKPPARYTQKQLYGRGVHQHVYEITSETAESFRFNLQQFLKQEAFIDGGGVQLADGGLLIPSNDGTAGKEEFHRALCDTPGVDPKLISEAWVYNHYRWIVWKQASMERSFPETMGSLCLTPEQVLLQLKYRYDVEVDHSRRPALRKIMEKDDTSAKTLVLCVCGVVSRGQSPNRQSFNDTKTPQGADTKVENPSAVVWLTDGWYTIKAQLDEPLTAMLNKGRVAVGGKLIIHGAQLVGSQDACSPLEAPESLMLKICANSSRPTRWDAKLGFHRDPRPFLLPVSCLYSSGGPVGCVDIIILRSYPIQWMERKPDGGVVFRSVRAEEKEARRYNSIKQKAMEILYAKIQAEFEKEDKGNKPQHRRRTITRQEISNLQDGEELYEAVGNDPAYLEAHLSEEQLETLRAYRCSLMEKKQAVLQDRYRRALESAEDSEGICPKREVTPVWRLCVADSMDQPGSVYQLNLWRPSSELQSLVKEGCRYKVYNLTTSDGKKHGCSTTVQLTGTKKSQFQDLQASQELLATHFQPRVSSCFVDLQNPEFQPLCGEIDLTGYVISIVDGQGKSIFFLKVLILWFFFLFPFPLLYDLVKPHVLLALSNLQLRGQSTSPTPVVYAGDLTLFSTNPKEVHLQESLSQLKNLIQVQSFSQSCLSY
uniref:BRCA2 DNA repair associated n=1 Tax=Sander lucioperca TaxID=283035 RepID=A0A8C9YT01_SANLU